jgi:hypothetical protein
MPSPILLIIKVSNAIIQFGTALFLLGKATIKMENLNLMLLSPRIFHKNLPPLTSNLNYITVLFEKVMEQ